AGAFRSLVTVCYLEGVASVAKHEVTFPIADEQEILKLRAGDEVVVQGHIIGIRDRTQIRIFDEGVEPPMELRGAFLLHTAPGVKKVKGDARGAGSQELTGRSVANINPAISTAKYEPVCIGTTT